MTKAEAKTLIKEYYHFEKTITKEKIVDTYIWKDETDGEFLYQLITVSRNHCPYCYSGYFRNGKVIPLVNSTGLLVIGG